MSIMRLWNQLTLATRAARYDRIRFLATALICAAIEFSLLVVFAVAKISPGDGPYASGLLQQPPLREGLLTGLALLTVPLVALVAQSSQLGALARDRRLAGYRLTGGTANEVRRIAVAECLLPAFAGALTGASAFVAAQRLLDGPLTVWGSYVTQTVTKEGPYAKTVVSHVRHGWVRLAPTDVNLPTTWILISLLLVPLIAAASAWVTLRPVRVTPLSVIRRSATMRPPAQRAVVLLAVGLGGLLSYSYIRSLLGQPGHATKLDAILVVAFFALAAGSLVLGSATLSARVGEWVSERTSSAAPLIAGRRLQTDPYAGSRTLSLIVLALVVAVSGQAVKAHFLVITDPSDAFYADTLRLVDVGYVLALTMASLGVVLRTVEGAANSRRQFAMQLASGIPRATLRRSLVLETLLPLTPTAILASIIGVLGVRGILGTSHVRVVGNGRDVHAVTLPIPIPWMQTFLLTLGMLVITTALSWATLSFTNRQLDAADLRVSN